MILRDPVHGLVAFEGRAERVVQTLLDTREVQRLRRVRQLGLASLVFPGAEHSRFSHALGAAHVMERLQRRVAVIERDLPPHDRLDDEAAADALAAALLHDLGHGPFSHMFEEVLPRARHHEDWTRQLIEDPATEVHRALEALDRGMADRVADLLRGDYRLPYLARSVSGTLDVDRADYLLRDSHMTGVRYGLYDLDWVLQALCFAEVGGQWVLAVEGRKGLPPIESFFLGRHFMFQQVYHHKATRAAEAIVRAIFVRVRELVQAGSPPESTPVALRKAALGEPISLGEYFSLDDATLITSLSRWEQATDPWLAEFAQALNARRLPKTVPLPERAPERWPEIYARASEVVADRGGRADLRVWLDEPDDVPYQEPDDDSPKGLWVAIRHHPVQRLGDASFLLGEFRNKRIVRPRLIFPESSRGAVLDAIESLIAL
ncbi:MAG: HD domain-containing protein [Myxococcales bacterium]|nr:HD domain-containing protein [Myxococcales bacterium]